MAGEELENGKCDAINLFFFVIFCFLIWLFAVQMDWLVLKWVKLTSGWKAI